MIITNADDNSEYAAESSSEMPAGENRQEPADNAPRRLRPALRSTAIADRLRYVHVGPRARAETVVQQRQPGLVEAHHV